MKKAAAFCAIIGLSAMVFLAGCNSNNAPVPSTTPDMPVESSAVVVPEWAKPVQERGQLIQNLNLDGVGDSDDEAYVSIYRWDNVFDAATVISVHLGTGETLAEVYPIYGVYTFETGHLISEEKDAILLELVEPRTNWGASDIIVLDVYAVGNDAPYIIERLNTQRNPITLESDGNPMDRTVSGTYVADISGQILQGLSVHFLGPGGKWDEQYQTIQWTKNGSEADSGWSITEDYTSLIGAEKPVNH